MPDQPTIFADGILDASVTHGVVRVNLAQTGADGKPIPAGQIIVPLVQLPGVANGLISLLRQVESKLKEAQGQQAAAAAPPVEAAPPPVTGAFRFGS